MAAPLFFVFCSFPSSCCCRTLPPRHMHHHGAEPFRSAPHALQVSPLTTTAKHVNWRECRMYLIHGFLQIRAATC